MSEDKKINNAHNSDEDETWERMAWARASANNVTLTDSLTVRGEDAIWSRDLEKLRAALEEGWSIPSFRTGNARRTSGTHGEDLSLIIQCVSSGWTEGWRLLRERWPDLASNDQLLLTALATARPEILDDILSHAPRTVASRFSSHDGPRPRALSSLPRLKLFKEPEVDQAKARHFHHELFVAMIREVGEAAEPEDILACSAILEKHGSDPSAPYPGTFTEDDMSMAGHTLWTLAIHHHKWEVVSGLAPTTMEDIKKHPRWNESLDLWFEIAWVGHRVMLYLAPPSLLAQEAWLSSMSHLSAEWLDYSHQLIQYSGWPCIIAMSPEHRAPLWHRLMNPREGELHGLSWIALGAEQNPEDANRLITLWDAEVSDKEALATAWRSSVHGDRPCDVWARARGKPSSSQWPPELIDVQALSSE